MAELVLAMTVDAAFEFFSDNPSLKRSLGVIREFLALPFFQPLQNFDLRIGLDERLSTQLQLLRDQAAFFTTCFSSRRNNFSTPAT